MRELKWLLLLCLIAGVIVGCEDNPPPTLPPASAGGGFVIVTQKSFNGAPPVVEPSVEVDNAWQGDLAGASGDPTPFTVITTTDGVATAIGKRAPAKWKLTWVASADETNGCDGQFVTNNVQLNGTTGITCLETLSSYSTSSSANFSMSPNPVYISAPPSAATVTGSGLSTTYGMPLVQYYTLDGTLITQENATSVSGTSMQIAGFNISQLPVGTYAAFVSNAASGGTYTFVGTGAVQVYTGPAPATGWVTINGSEGCASGVCDQGSVHITVNGFTASVSYGNGSSGGSIASALVSILNGSSSPVHATLSGATVNMTAKTTGFSSGYALSAGSSSGAPLTSFQTILLSNTVQQLFIRRALTH